MILAMIHSIKRKNNQDITKEDPRTSTMFDALLHLPDRLMWEVLRKACHDRKVLPLDLGVLEYYEFWPQWNAEGTDHEQYIEPDVFLRFSKADLIVEAKRFDTSGQDQWQWERELIAYENKYGFSDRSAFLISLGGNGNNLQNQTIGLIGHERTVVKCSWVSLHAVLIDKRKRLTGSDRRVVDSLLLACNLFGFRSYKWLEDKPWVADYVIEITGDYRNLIFRR